jgi:alkanesulfonate monooxygenase SsuD/methylene tetrahydromethanopterin reductase-like flavin-dependent oxidoreductase (luciferase family)
VAPAEAWRQPHLGSTEWGRAVDLSYLAQVAKAADTLGYYGVLLLTGRSCEDSWVIASALVPLTERLRFLVAVLPGLQSPTLAGAHRQDWVLDRACPGKASAGSGVYAYVDRVDIVEHVIGTPVTNELHCRLT